MGIMLIKWDLMEFNGNILGFKGITLWLLGIIGKMALIEIDGLPFLKFGIFHGYVSHNQMVIWGWIWGLLAHRNRWFTYL